MTTRANRIERLTAAMLAGLLVLIMNLPAVAVPQVETIYGGQSPWYSAELNAQGNTGAASGRGGYSNVLNPAGLAWSTGLNVDLGLFMVRHEEDRFMPVYDTFESRVIDMAIASNQNTWLGGGFGLALRNPRLPVVVGVSLVERYPFRYLFEEEIRDPNTFSSPRDRIIEERRYEVTGALRTLSLGLAGLLLDERLAVGASLHYAFGDHDQRWLVRDNVGNGSYDNRWDWQKRGFNATFGLQGKLSDRLTLGVAYETRLEVDGDHMISSYRDTMTVPEEFSSQQSMRYPDYWRAGLAFYPRSDPRTIFTADVVYSDWAKIDDSRFEPEDLDLVRSALQDVIDVRIGIEHTFYNQARLRFGFRRFESYADRDGGNSIFSAGAGWPLALGQLSFSLELNKIQSTLTHIFAYPEGYYAQDVARVDDNRLRFGCSWSRGF